MDLGLSRAPSLKAVGTWWSGELRGGGDLSQAVAMWDRGQMR